MRKRNLFVATLAQTALFEPDLCHYKEPFIPVCWPGVQPLTMFAHVAISLIFHLYHICKVVYINSGTSVQHFWLFQLKVENPKRS